jgi:hypothetical protein
MKRYLVFAGDDYYPCGGWDDFVGSWETIEEVREAMNGRLKIPGDGWQWWHAVDTRSPSFEVTLS